MAWNFKKEPRQVSLLPRTLVILSLFLAFRRRFFRHFFSPLGGSILSCDILAGNISLLSVIVYHGPVVVVAPYILHHRSPRQLHQHATTGRGLASHIHPVAGYLVGSFLSRRFCSLRRRLLSHRLGLSLGLGDGRCGLLRLFASWQDQTDH